MARVTNKEVGAILETTDTDFTPFIESANIIVTKVLSNTSKITDADQLKNIERWLAGHFYMTMQGDIKSEKIGETQVTYRGTEGLGLDGTRWGQQAKLLDTSGALSNIGKTKSSFNTILAIDDAE